MSDESIDETPTDDMMQLLREQQVQMRDQQAQIKALQAQLQAPSIEATIGTDSIDKEHERVRKLAKDRLSTKPFQLLGRENYIKWRESMISDAPNRRCTDSHRQ